MPEAILPSQGPLITATPDGFLFGSRVYFFGDGSFIKAGLPGLRAVMIRLVGGGGGAGSCEATGATQACAAGGGGGGAYSETFVLESALGATETVTVGDGGAGDNAASGGNAPGDAGEASSFGTHCVAAGGDGGVGDAARGTPYYSTSGAAGGLRGAGTGDLRIEGGKGEAKIILEAAISPVSGGNTIFSPQRGQGQTSGGANGANGKVYGGGGVGGANADDQGSARSGGNGAKGLVIVDTFF